MSKRHLIPAPEKVNSGEWRVNSFPLSATDCPLPTEHRPLLPTVSVVVPTLGRPQLLDRCLASLLNQTLPAQDYEVLVVADGPDPATEDIVRRRRERRPEAAIHYRSSNRSHGPAAARNVGWRSAKGTVIAFTDDDCMVDPGWLAAGSRALLRRTGVAAIWGRIIVPLPEEPTDWERNVARLERAPCATANCFYRRDILERIGGFDERFTEAWREDSDLQFETLTRGWTILHEPRAVVTHPARPAPWGISIPLQKQNRFNALLYKKHPRLYRLFNPHEPPWSYYVMVCLLTVSAAAWPAGSPLTAAATLLVWFGLAAQFCWRRLTNVSRRPGHIMEMALTSAIIPPYAVFWRLYGAAKYRVAFF